MYPHYEIVYNHEDGKLYIFSARFDEIELMYIEYFEFGINITLSMNGSEIMNPSL
jgi:hypothetical protein